MKKTLFQMIVVGALAVAGLLGPQPVSASVRGNQPLMQAQKEKTATRPQATLKKFGSVIGVVVVLSAFSLLFIKKRRVDGKEEEK